MDDCALCLVTWFVGVARLQLADFFTSTFRANGFVLPPPLPRHLIVLCGGSPAYAVYGSGLKIGRVRLSGFQVPLSDVLLAEC